jgi:dTMP kinase
LLVSLQNEIQQGLEPDLTLLLDAPLEIGADRISARVPDHFESEQRPFFERVRAAYLALAAEHPDRVRTIDASRPLTIVQQLIEAEVRALVERLEERRS